MLTVTRDMVLVTTVTGSYPKPNWYNQGLHGRPFKAALGDTLFREQYLDAGSVIINNQGMAGLDNVTDGDSRFDLEVHDRPPPRLPLTQTRPQQIPSGNIGRYV